jgi:hypothetical protein
MVKIPNIQDPTLTALDRALEQSQHDGPRPYLGASAIGDSCERKLWLSFHWVKRGFIEASGLRRIEDGHRGEKILADWLRMVPGVDLSTEKDNGYQHSFEDLGGHFRGNCDGLITGLLQSPKKLHVWECKIINETKFKKLQTLKLSKGEENALREWDYVYYAQAQIYMHYFKAERHYLTAGSPGVRDITSVRTEYDQAEAEKLIKKAERIIFSSRPPAKISDNPAWHECKFCSFHAMCHEDELPQQPSCRTCMYSTPERNGVWKCEKHEQILTTDMQRQGCADHLFHPNLVPAEQVDYGEGWVEYKLRDGTIWKNQAKS